MSETLNDKYFDVERDVIEVTRSKYGRVPSMIYVVGQRGVGKTHTALRECLINAITNKKFFVYVRRYTTEIRNKDMNTVFSNVIDDELTKKALERSEFSGYPDYAVLVKSGVFWLCGISDNNVSWLFKVGTITCISQAEYFKGGTYGDFNRVIFDEFITERGYVSGDKEPEKLEKIIQTIGRKPQPGEETSSKNIITYLCGNPDNSIEACPYLYKLHLDYARLQSNMVYYFERRNGEISTFLKVAGMQLQYIDNSVSDLFGTSENEMALTGEVKTNNYIQMTEEIKRSFVPVYKLIVETPIIAEKEYHRIIYAYYGELRMNGATPEVVVLITCHDIFKEKESNVLYCRYDADRYIPRKYVQTWRLAIPHHERFAGLNSMMEVVGKNHLIFTDDNNAATLYESIAALSA